MTHTEALQIAVAAMPDKDPAVLSACINADGTVSTYTWPNVPEWLTKSGVKTRNRIAQALKDAHTTFSEQSADGGRLAETDKGVLVRTYRKGEHCISLVPDEGRVILYKGPNVSEAITAWYSALGVKVLVMYHRGDTLYPLPEPGTAILWLISTTRPVTKNLSSPVAGDVLRIGGKNFQVIETYTGTEQ